MIEKVIKDSLTAAKCNLAAQKIHETRWKCLLMYQKNGKTSSDTVTAGTDKQREECRLWDY